MITHPLFRRAWTVPACAALAACGGATPDAGDAVATATGSEQRADRSATNVNGNGNTTTFAIAGDGRQVALGNSSTNLLTLPRRTYPWQVYVKTLQGAPAAPWHPFARQEEPGSPAGTGAKVPAAVNFQ